MACRRGLTGFLLLAVSAGSAACNDEATARPQVLLVFDTNAPLISQLATRPELSESAAVDTLIVDIVKSDQSLTVLVGDELDWPVSIGIPRGDRAPGSKVLVRARLFRDILARPRTPSAEPNYLMTVDRVVELTLPDSGVEGRTVLLDMDCLGVRPSFAEPVTTCVDGSNRHASASTGIERGAASLTRAGTWAAAVETPCEGSAPDGRVCIPGGFTALGDADLGGLVDGLTFQVNPSPVRPVLLSRYDLDRTEYTVGRLRALLAQDPGALSSPLPESKDAANPDRAQCTWLGMDDAQNDAFPLNCVFPQTARELCKLAGGALPSEAQWERAARGRGERRTFPWGEAVPECCALSVGHGAEPECVTQGPEPVASHLASDACSGLGDVSRDGVVDMAGSMREMTADRVAPYDAAADCGQPEGLLLDPHCDNESTLYITRGLFWDGKAMYGPASLRFSSKDGLLDATHGFRCAYPDP